MTLLLLVLGVVVLVTLAGSLMGWLEESCDDDRMDEEQDQINRSGRA